MGSVATKLTVKKKRPGPLVLTGSAVKKVKTLIDEEGNPALKLRVFVQGGGCSGYQYGFTFDEDVGEGDTVINFSCDQNVKEDDAVAGFTFIEEPSEAAATSHSADTQEESEITVRQDDFSLLVDEFSYHYLVGAQIDYKDDINGAQFVIKNPNATTTCGCGSSFSA